MPESLLTNKVVVVTGSTAGIGQAIARRAAEEGAYVMVNGRSADQAEALAKEIGERAAFVVADLADPGSPARIVDAAIKRFGRIDGLVNNAALMTRSNIDTTDAEFFDHMMAVNARAGLLMIQAAVSHFRRQGGGVVLNIGSVNAHCGEPNLLVYSMTKGAMMTMTRNLSDALSLDRIRVNQINVGWTMTENEKRIKALDGLTGDWESRLPKSVAPAGRILRPEEVAAHAVFWLSDSIGPVSGAVYELEQVTFIGRNPIKATE